MQVPIPVSHLFRPLDDMLQQLLRALSPDEWRLPTVAREWTVKDVASHLLDGNLRVLSIQRDRYYGEKPPAITSYQDLVAWLNRLNADWVVASRRLSPRVLTMLHELTGPPTCEFYENAPLWDDAPFAVSWAGEERSVNWMHLAREYTEKWHHHQQIRDATGRDGIMTHEFFFPVMDAFMRALPHTFRAVDAAAGTTVAVTITTAIGGTWHLVRRQREWQLEMPRDHDASVAIPPDIAWKLFSKSIRPAQIKDQVTIDGDKALAGNVLEMISVMA